ncbi:MAG TPA: site-2 protease family protein [Candidatus Binatia bacterium]|nr:site-2 protease family protein [Candidatus Binatia bacterium]
MGLLLSILVISLVVLVHEYGHYVLMRRNGVKVIEFTIGFGPTLFERQLKSGTMFRIKPILLGGYARPVTEDGAEGNIEAASAWAKFKIYMAGMFFNCCAAFVVFTGLFYSTHRAPAMFVEYAHLLHAPPALMPLAAAFVGSFGMWLATPVIVVWLIAQGVQQFFGGMAGPIGIIGMGGQVAAQSHDASSLLMNMLMFFGLINIGLAGFNLLPIFPLDGGRVFDLLLEKLSGGHAKRVCGIYRIASTALFIGFIVLVIASDVLKAFLAMGR